MMSLSMWLRQLLLLVGVIIIAQVTVVVVVDVVLVNQGLKSNFFSTAGSG